MLVTAGENEDGGAGRGKTGLDRVVGVGATIADRAALDERVVLDELADEADQPCESRLPSVEPRASTALTGSLP